MSFRSIRSDFWAALQSNEPVTCPLCLTTCTIYRRPLNRGMIRSLLYIWRACLDHPDRVILISKYALGKSVALDLHHDEYTKLPYWGLITNLGTIDGSSVWCVTHLGDQFIRRPDAVTVPRYAHVLHNQVLRHEGPEINIYEAYRQRFDLGDLLNPRPEL